MAAISKIIKSALSNQLAPANIATHNSSLGLQTSAGAMRALQESGKKDSQTIVQLTNGIPKAGELSQKTTNTLSAKAGQVTQRLHQLEALEKPFMAAMDSAVKAAELRSRMAEKAAKAGQKIAVLDAKTQASIGWGHQQAHAETVYHQSAYGGSNFSV